MDNAVFMESDIKYKEQDKSEIIESKKFRDALFQLCKSWAEQDYKILPKPVSPTAMNKNKYDKYEIVRILLEYKSDDTKTIKEYSNIGAGDDFDFKLNEKIKNHNLKDFYTNANPEEYEKIGESFVSTWDFITAIEKNISYEITQKCDDKHNILNVSFKSDNFVLYYYRCKLIYDFRKKEPENLQRNKIDEIFVSTMLNHITYKFEEKEKEEEKEIKKRTKLPFSDIINDDSIIKAVNNALGYLAYDKKSNVKAKDIYKMQKGTAANMKGLCEHSL
jgi:hypothetical protein